MKLNKKILPVLVAAMVLFSSATISFAGDIDPKGRKDEHFFEENGWHWEDWTTDPHEGMTWDDLGAEIQAGILRTKGDYDRALVKAEIDAKANAEAAANAAEKSRQAAEAKAKFWNDLSEQINNAKSGEYIEFDAGDYREMPASIMQALKDKKIGLIVKYDGKVQFTIPADGTLEIESNRLFYRLSDLCAGYNKIEAVVDACFSALNANNPTTLNGNNPTTAGFARIDDLVIDFLGNVIQQYNDLTYLGKQFSTTADSVALKDLGLTDNVKDINVSTVALASMTNIYALSTTPIPLNSMFGNYTNFQLVSQLLKADQLATATSAAKELAATAAATVNMGDDIKIVAGNGTNIGVDMDKDTGGKKPPADGNWEYEEYTISFNSKELPTEWGVDNNDKFFKSNKTKGTVIKGSNNNYYYLENIDPSKLTDSKADELKAAIDAAIADRNDSEKFAVAEAKLNALRAELAYGSTGTGVGTGTNFLAIGTNDYISGDKKPPATGTWEFSEETKAFNSDELPAEWSKYNNEKFFKSNNTKGVVIKYSDDCYNYFDDIDPSKLTDQKFDELNDAINTIICSNWAEIINEAKAKLDALRAELAYVLTAKIEGIGTGEVTTKRIPQSIDMDKNTGGKKPPADGNWEYAEYSASFASNELPAEWGVDNNDKFFKSKNTKGVVIKGFYNNYYYLDDIDPSKLTDKKAVELKAALADVNAAYNDSKKFAVARAKLDALRAELSYGFTFLTLGNNSGNLLYFNDQAAAIPVSYGNVSNIANSYAVMLESQKTDLGISDKKGQVNP